MLGAAPCHRKNAIDVILRVEECRRNAHLMFPHGDIHTRGGERGAQFCRILRKTKCDDGGLRPGWGEEAVALSEKPSLQLLG